MNSSNLLIKAMQEYFNETAETVFPRTDSGIEKSLDFALSVSKYLAALDAVDRARVTNVMEFILANPLNDRRKESVSNSENVIERKPRTRSRLPNKNAKKKKPQKKKKINAQVAGYVNHENIEGTDHNIVFRLDLDHVMEVRKGRFPYRRDPKIGVRDNKAFEYRESHSSYCGERKTLKNWLYFV